MPTKKLPITPSFQLAAWAAGVAALLLLAVSPAPAQSPAATSVNAQIAGPPLIVEVPLPADGPVSQSATISVTDEMRGLFGADNPIQWAPDAMQSPLKAVLTDEPREVSLGEQDQNQVIIAFERGLLLPDQPRKITVTVRDPGHLAAGIYQGSIVSTLSALRSEGVSVRYVWPVTLRVRGRHIFGARFQAADPRRPTAGSPVGRPATVSLLVETVDCPLGEGLLEIKSPSSESFACLPVPLAGPVDAATAFPSLTHRLLAAAGKKAVWPSAWNNHPLNVRALPSAERTAEDSTVKPYKVSVVLPHLSEPGNWKADFQWERGEAGGLTDPLQVQAAMLATPGIIVSTPLAIVGESVSIHLLSDSDLGPTVPLVVGPRSGSEPEALIAEQILLDARGVGGKFFEYRAAFAPAKISEYSIRIAKESAGDPKLAAIEEATFQAAFQATGSLGRELVLFRGASPAWPFWQGTPSDGGGYECTRLGALSLDASSTDQFRNLSADLIAVGRIGDGKSKTLETPADWRREPTLAFPTQSTDGKLAVYESKTPTPTGTPIKTWTSAECPNGRLAFDLKLSIPQEPQGADDEAASAFGERLYAMRLLVRGEDPNGAPVARIIQVPYRTVITNDLAYYKPWAMWGGGAFGLVLLGVAVYFLVNRRNSPPAKAGQSAALTPPISNMNLAEDPREYDYSENTAVHSPSSSTVVSKSGNGAVVADEPPAAAEPSGYDVFADDSSSSTDNDMFRE